VTVSDEPRAAGWWFFLWWMLTFLGFPLGGLLALMVVRSLGGRGDRGGPVVSASEVPEVRA
jgi:hypothetical protein